MTTVLICDDQKFVVERFRKRHQDHGVNVIECKSLQALRDRLLKSSNPLPDIVLLDLYWPNDDTQDYVRGELNEKYKIFREAWKDFSLCVKNWLHPSGIEVLEDIREKIPAYKLPILIYTRTSPYVLEPNQIDKIVELDAGFLFKDQMNVTPFTELRIIEKYIAVFKRNKVSKRLPKEWMWDVFLSSLFLIIGLVVGIFI